MANTGYKAWALLEEYTIETGIRTGNERPNVSSDPFYVAPVLNLTDCPLPSTMESYTANATATPACASGYSSPFSSVTGQASGMVPVAAGPARDTAIGLLNIQASGNAQSNANATCVLTTPVNITAHLSATLVGPTLTLTLSRDGLYNSINGLLDVAFTVKRASDNTNIYSNIITLTSGLGPYTQPFNIGVATAGIVYILIITSITTGYSCNGTNVTST